MTKTSQTSNIVHITSTTNPKVKQALKLRERRQRDKTQLYLIEGYRELSRAVKTKTPLDHLFICPDFFLGSNEDTLIKDISKKNVPVYQCSKTVFAKLSYRDRPDGLLAVAQQKHLSLANIKKGSFLLVVEAIEKPGNLGTILRSADAAGVDAVIVCDQCTDIFNPNVVRASVGTLFTVPVIEATSSETISWLKKKKILTLAATPSAKKVFTKVNLKQSLAIAVGTEQLGLSEQWMEQAELQVRIPMKGIADSLNVATATTLLLYEVVRQRND